MSSKRALSAPDRPLPPPPGLRRLELGEPRRGRRRLVDTINQLRGTIGLAPYARWNAESCASRRAQADAASGTAHGAFGSCGESAQDECPGWPGPPETMIGQCLAQMWAEGPGSDFSTHGHYINMSSTSYTMAACGFFVLPDGSVWATQNFK